MPDTVATAVHVLPSQLSGFIVEDAMACYQHTHQSLRGFLSPLMDYEATCLAATRRHGYRTATEPAFRTRIKSPNERCLAGQGHRPSVLWVLKTGGPYQEP